ncbi:MAG: DALR anticodon-binding domain-containing protein, partial [Kiloniellales bacterium]
RVLEQSRDNPVFYVQYAHARVRSIMRHARAMFSGIQQEPEALAAGPLNLLTDSDELGLIKHLTLWPRLLESAAETYEPHRVAFYLYDLAAAFHSLWTKGKEKTQLRFLLEDDAEQTAARLALVQGVALVIAAGLDIFSVQPVEEMR